MGDYDKGYEKFSDLEKIRVLKEENEKLKKASVIADIEGLNAQRHAKASLKKVKADK